MGGKSDWIKVYPQLFAKTLKQYPLMTDREELKNLIENRTDQLLSFFDEENGIDVKGLFLTEEELDMILDLHGRVLNNEEVNILTEVTAENLA